MKTFPKILLMLIFIQCQPPVKDNPAKAEIAGAENAPYPDKKMEAQVINANVALEFMNDYVGFCNNNRNDINGTHWIKNNPLATDDFKTKYIQLHEDAKKEDPYGLGFDAILNAQDYPDEGFVILNCDSIEGYVVLQGKIWKDFTVPVKLSMQDNKWLVDGAGVVNIPEDRQRKK